MSFADTDRTGVEASGLGGHCGTGSVDACAPVMPADSMTAQSQRAEDTGLTSARR
jgi:hypothetical protein